MVMIRALLCILSFIFILSSEASRAQSWNSRPQKGFVYRITNKEAQRLLQQSGKDRINDALLHTLVDTFDVEKGWVDRPASGHFITVMIDGNRLLCEYTSVFPYQVFLLKEYDALSLQVLDFEGNIRDDAKVKFRRYKRIPLDSASKTYRLENTWVPGSGIVTVELDGFRSIFNVEKHEVPYWYSDPASDSRASYYSYMITDKNRYKPNETIRFKSFALSGTRSPLRRDLDLWLLRSGKPVKLSSISPHRRGSYSGEFQLHDSLKLILDNKYTLQLRERKGRVVASTSFRYEDYELHNYKLEAWLSNHQQFHPEANELQMVATDVNGLILKDARASVAVLSSSIQETFAGVAILPDTLMYTEIDLDPANPTVVPIPSSLFGSTNTAYEVVVTVTNSERWRMEKRLSSTHYYNNVDLTARLEDGSVIYELKENGKVVQDVLADLRRGDGIASEEVILPHRELINPMLRHVTIGTEEVSGNIDLGTLVPTLEVLGGIQQDSFRIQLNNPHKLEISWYLYQGGELVEKGSGKELEYRSIITNRSETYHLDLLYVFAGEHHLKRREFPFRDDRLDVTLDIPDRVYPGQRVDATIQVLDQQGNPVNNVDLTALATTARLGHHLPDLPYYGNTSAPRSRSAHYSHTGLNKRSAQLPLDYSRWRTLANLDTMKYFQLLYPGKRMFRASVPIEDSTQFSIFLLKRGSAKDPYVVEVDKKPVYFSWVDRPKDYSFYVRPDKPVQVSVRLHDRVLVLDTLRFDPGRKTVLSLDVDNLPETVSVHRLYKPSRRKRANEYPVFTQTELSRYSSYVSSFRRIAGRAWLESGIEFTPLFHEGLPQSGNRVIIGPISPGKQSLFIDDVQKIIYTHSGGFQYEFDENVVYKLNADDLFPKRLYDTQFSLKDRLEDMAFSRERFHNLEPRNNKWIARVIDLVDHSCRVSLRLPPDQIKTGIARLLFQDCASGEVTVPCQNAGRNGSQFFTIPRGLNNVIVVYEDGSYNRMDSVSFRSHTRILVDMSKASVMSTDSLSQMWMTLSGNNCFQPVATPSRTFDMQYRHVRFGNVRGTIFDASNRPIPGCNIVEKGTLNGAITDADGNFSLDISGSSATLVISFIGFQTEEVDVRIGSDVTVFLQEDVQMLSEVVVVGFGAQSRASLTGSVAGIHIRGLSSVTGDFSTFGFENEPGREPAFDEAQEINDASADLLYEELMLLNNIRFNFSDVGFWEPRLSTDRKGTAEFTVTFPEDITRWDATVYAMNRRLQTGTVRKYIRSYKPLMAQLETPRFLNRGDSALLIGKVLNYTSDKQISGRVEWSAFDITNEKPVAFQDYHTAVYGVSPVATDSVTTSFVFTRDDGYIDGEQRTIPVIEQGVVRANGSLAILEDAAPLRIQAAANENITIEVFATPLDIFEGQAKHLLNYKYDCNEQLASKLVGLIQYRSIVQYNGRPFNYDRDVKRIISRLLNNQNTDFLWSWWDVSPNTSHWMSAHILRALHAAHEAGYKVDLSLENIARKATYRFEFLQEFRIEDIDLLNALAIWGVKLDYAKYTDTLQEVLLTEAAGNRGEWRPVSTLTDMLRIQEIRQLTKLNWQRDSLTKYVQQSMTGELYLSDSRRAPHWRTDALIANSIAYRIASRDSVLSSMLPRMQLYFVKALGQREWNTYESANVLGSILPGIVSEGVTRDQPSRVELSGTWNEGISSFPWKAELDAGKEVVIAKQSGLPVYLMRYSKERVTQATTGVEGFAIQTYFGNGERTLLPGKPVKFVVEVDVLKDAATEHVMIEVPIPAACSYADKTQRVSSVETHREYFQDRTVIFCEKLKPGKYHFSLDLLPRFGGKYHVNPAQVSLMYVPVVNANTDMKVIKCESAK